MKDHNVNPVHQRLAELTIRRKVGKLTPDEEVEFEQCLDWNVRYCWRKALLLNYSLMASMTKDINWQHDICGELDKW